MAAAFSAAWFRWMLSISSGLKSSNSLSSLGEGDMGLGDISDGGSEEKVEWDAVTLGDLIL